MPHADYYRGHGALCFNASTAPGHHRDILPAQEVRQLGGVGHCLIAVAVV
jgi:hypothetical protein